MQLLTNADNAALPATAAAIDRYFVPAGPAAANPPHDAAEGKQDRQTDGHSPYRIIDPAPHTTLKRILGLSFVTIYSTDSPDGLPILQFQFISLIELEHQGKNSCTDR